MPSPSRKASPGRKGSPKKPSPSQKFSNTLLYDSAENGDIDTVKEQIDLGADVNWAISKNFYNTPLIVSARNGHADVVETLLEKADKNQGNYARETPIFVASTYGKLSVIEILISHKVDVKKKNNMGYTPLHQAVLLAKPQMNHLKIIEIIKLLLDNGADINAQNKGGTTPLHLASMSNNEDIVFLLLDNGANINIQNQFGQTASQMARSQGSDKLAEMIENWRTISTIAMLEHRGDYNKMDLNDFKLLRKFIGGKRTTRGKRLLGRKTRSNRR